MGYRVSFEVERIDWLSLDLVPAYDLGADMFYFAFRVDHVPTYHFCGPATVIVYNTYTVEFYDEMDDVTERVSYSCRCRPDEYENMMKKIRKEE